MFTTLVISTIMAVATVAFHMTGLGLLLAAIRKRPDHFRPPISVARQAVFIMSIVLGLFVLHGVEIWAHALLFLALGEFPNLETALYFSISTFTTLGYGEIVMSEQWRLVGAMEGFTGFLMIGWSTAFLVSVVGRLRTLELDWVERAQESAEADRADSLPPDRKPR